MFTSGKWIWENTNNNKDEYVKFYTEFNAFGEVSIDISCDSNYTLYVNGVLVGFGAMADYPHYKIKDTINITKYINNEESNKLLIIVWYYGDDSQVYQKGNAGLLFKVYYDDNIFAYSDHNTLCKIAQDFVCYKCKKITNQLGYSFCYDSNYYDNYNLNNFSPINYHNSIEIENISYDLHSRDINMLDLLPIKKAKLINPQKNIYDLMEESVGFLAIKFRANATEKITIAFGEHIVDGVVRHKIGIRDFTIELIANGEMFEYLNTFRRLGMRYFQILEPKDVEIAYIGLRETVYPIKAKMVSMECELDQRIYDTSVKTLQLCMHEHYEDCPWREQALYTMDSRNQMLCGYYAFSDFNFARANLNLMSKGLREDGMMPICFPCGADCPLPSFALIYVIQMYEYAKYSLDTTLLEKNIELLEKIIAKFTDRIEKNNLIPNFEEYWNFYEWSDGLDSAEGGYPIIGGIKDFDLPLNCDVVLALQCLDTIYQLLNFNKSNALLISKIQKAIYEKFYVKETGLFKTYLIKPLHFGVLPNSLAVLSGCANGKENQICDRIVTNTTEMVEITASMKIYEYDALILTNHKYKDFILSEIRRNYGFMLNNGATAFWETMKGEADFGGAGSLCHGWNTIAIYYYNKFKLI